MDIQRLSHLAFLDCLAETHEDLALQHFTDSVQGSETQKALRLANHKDIVFALFYAHKTEATQQASKKDWHMIRAVSATNPKTEFSKQIEQLQRKILRIKGRMNGRDRRNWCWDCGEDGHVWKNCPMPKDGGNNSRKPNLKIFQISYLSSSDNGLFVMWHVNKVPCHMIINTGTNVTIIRSDMAHKLGENSSESPALPSRLWQVARLTCMEKFISTSHLEMILTIMWHM